MSLWGPSAHILRWARHCGNRGSGCRGFRAPMTPYAPEHQTLQSPGCLGFSRILWYLSRLLECRREFEGGRRLLNWKYDSSSSVHLGLHCLSDTVTCCFFRLSYVFYQLLHYCESLCLPCTSLWVDFLPISLLWPCDHYRLLRLFCPGPKVVTVSHPIQTLSDFCFGRLLPHVWKGGTLVWKCWVIRYMPMKDIHLVHLHQIKIVENDSFWEEMARWVNKYSTMREAWAVENLRAVDMILKIVFNFNYWCLCIHVNHPAGGE